MLLRRTLSSSTFMNRELRRNLFQVGLFLITLATTTMAGAEWTYGESILMPGYNWSDFLSGLEFSVPFLLILTVHEFGHYFTARHHGVSVSLPWYIPLPPLPFSIGTMGAVIRLRSKVYSKKVNFDIGIAGPLAGFVMALVVLFYGFTNLPEPEYIYQIHPEYKKYGLQYADSVYNKQSDEILDVVVGKSLLFSFFENYVADGSRVPNAHEIMHYPILFAGFLSLVFTSLNLLPIGQLDGGHVVYGLFGFKIHRVIATIAFLVLIFYSGAGVLNPKDPPDDFIWWLAGAVLFLNLALRSLGLSKRDTLMYALLIVTILVLSAWGFPDVKGYSGWLFFVLLLGAFVGIQHPPSEIEEPLDLPRIILGWISLVIFIICFSPAPLEINLK